jgi:diguanylate cyclase (GGDEF)-like protein
MPLSDQPARITAYPKRLIALGFVITLGFSSVFGYVLWDMARRDFHVALDASTNLVASIEGDISRNIELYDSSLQTVVDELNRFELDKAGPELRRRIQFDHAMTTKNLDAILVLNRDGDVTMDSRVAEPPAVNYSQRDFFQAHQQRAYFGLYISRPWLANDGEYVVSLSRRISNSDGSFAGVIAASIKLSYFQDLFKKMRFGPHDVLALARADGTVLMRLPFNVATIGADIGRSKGLGAFSTSKAGWYQTVSVLDAVQRLFVFRRVGDYPLIVINGQAVDGVYAGWWKEAWLIGSLVLMLCGLNAVLVVFLSRELARRIATEGKLAIMARTDSLTGLCNRRQLDAVVESEWRRSARLQSPIAFLMIDVDCFKAYNDQLGHQAGDRALVAIAECIAAVPRRPPDLCARYGGEEFAVLLPGGSIEAAYQVAERIRLNVQSLHAAQQNKKEITPTISIGVASMIPNAGLNPGDLISTADAALYEAKRNGRNRTEMAPAIRLVAAERKLAAV